MIKNKQGPWIDAHVHLTSTEWFSGPIFPAQRKTNRRRQAPRKPLADAEFKGAARRASENRESRYGPGIFDRAQRIIDQMDDADIDIAILYAMDYDYTGKITRVDYWDQLVQLKACVDRHPGRFLLCAAVDPRRGKEGIEMLKRSVHELGVVGMGEFAPHFFGFAPNDREFCYPIYETCSDLGIPIGPNCSIIGNSHNSRWCHPLYFEDVAQDFPNLNIALTSGGAPHWIEEAIGLCCAKNNIFMDIGDWQSDKNHRPEETAVLRVKRIMEGPARHSLMFGSDYPVYTREYTEKAWVDLFAERAGEFGVTFTDEELHQFFSDNAQEFLDIDLGFPPGRERR